MKEIITRLDEIISLLRNKKGESGKFPKTPLKGEKQLQQVRAREGTSSSPSRRSKMSDGCPCPRKGRNLDLYIRVARAPLTTINCNWKEAK